MIKKRSSFNFNQFTQLNLIQTLSFQHRMRIKIIKTFYVSLFKSLKPNPCFRLICLYLDQS